MSISFNQCLSFINCQLTPQTAEPGLRVIPAAYRAITLSRQTGSGAHEVAEHLARLLQKEMPAPHCPWTVFDRNLVERVLEDHKLPGRLAQYMPEDRVSYFSDTVDELFGLHPSSDELIRQTAETILRLAHMGGVIVIGRGATVVTAKLDYVFHVRLVAQVEVRVRYLQKLQQLSDKAALDLIDREDKGRARYLRAHYNTEIDNPLLYHMVLNTGSLGAELAARLIVDAMRAGNPRQVTAPAEARA